MNARQLIDECLSAGVAIRAEAGKIKFRGAPSAVKSMIERLRPHKAAILEYLTAAANDDPEIAGPFTPYCCSIAPALVTELHRLIAEFAALYRLSESAAAEIIAAAKRQPASTIPAAIQYFQNSIKEKS